MFGTVVGACVENGTETEDLFNNILELDTVGFKSDTSPLKLVVGNGFRIIGEAVVVIIVGWFNLDNEDKCGVKEVCVDTRCLIKSFIKAGL